MSWELKFSENDSKVLTSSTFVGNLTEKRRVVRGLLETENIDLSLERAVVGGCCGRSRVVAMTPVGGRGGDMHPIALMERSRAHTASERHCCSSRTNGNGKPPGEGMTLIPSCSIPGACCRLLFVKKSRNQLKKEEDDSVQK